MPVVSREEAFRKGLNIRAAKLAHPVELSTWLISELGKLVEFIDAKKTLTSEEDLIFTAESILQDHPTLTLEEIAVIFQEIKQGKWGKFYERLKTPEILEIFRTFEGQRGELLERIHKFDNDNRYSQRIGGGDPWEHLRTSINPNG